MPKRFPSNPRLALRASTETEAIARQVLARLRSTSALVVIAQRATMRTRFANSDVLDVTDADRLFGMANDEGLQIELYADFDGRVGWATTTRTDAGGLDALAADAAMLAKQSRSSDPLIIRPPASFTDPPLYFDATADAGAPEMQADLARHCAAATEDAGLVGAGDISVLADALCVVNTAGFVGHTCRTYAEIGVSARTPNGRASGWARGCQEDVSKLDAGAITARAIDLAKRSDGAVAVEPGRYTVILEPEVVSAFVNAIVGGFTGHMNAQQADRGHTVFGKPGGGNRIGQQMTDPRVQLYYDPGDPDLPLSPLRGNGALNVRTALLENGVLRNLYYDDAYAKKTNVTPVHDGKLEAKLEITGTPQSLEGMIASTKRGVWVHRIASLACINQLTLLVTGVTRDGTFLIENGKITKPVKNLRFLESPFFVFSKIDAFGPPVRADQLWATPRLKVHDFEFTSLSDAV